MRLLLRSPCWIPAVVEIARSRDQNSLGETQVYFFLFLFKKLDNNHKHSITTMARVSMSSLLLCLSIALSARAACAASPESFLNGACDAIADQAICKNTAGCTWCVSAAVPSSCFSEADAAKLPAAVFTCSKTGALTLE